MRRDVVCSASAWNFAQMEDVWRHFKPQTPYGRDRAAEKTVYVEPDALVSLYDDVEAFGAFVERLGPDRSRLDKISWHLGRLPRLPVLAGETTAEGQRKSASGPKDTTYESAVDIFLYKKFLANYSRLCDLVDEKTREHFAMEFRSGDILSLLSLGGSDAETFYISEKYDSRLLGIRNSIAEIGCQIEEKRARAAGAVKEALGIDFSGRDFVTVPRATGLELLKRGDLNSKWHLYIEVNDEYSFMARLVPDSGMLLLESERSKLYETERTIEDIIIADLSERLKAEAASVSAYVGIVSRFDLAKSRFELEKKYNLRRPAFIAGDRNRSQEESGVRTDVRQGVFIPLYAECGKMGTKYTPLDITLDRNAAVIFGSNMGGKTVVLKSLLFFQLMAQTGLGVPAASYATTLFSSIDYVGDRPDTAAKGLSSFGFEVRALSDILEKAASHTCLVAFDEFAQTTSSREAEALLSSVVSFFARAQKPCLALFATHFQGVARDKDTLYFRMAGLDIEAARRYFGELADNAGAYSLAERIKNINTIMRYYVVPEDIERGGADTDGSDALEVASLLGLDEKILAAAKAYRSGTGRGSR